MRFNTGDPYIVVLAPNIHKVLGSSELVGHVGPKQLPAQNSVIQWVMTCLSTGQDVKNRCFHPSTFKQEACLKLLAFYS